jgi:galactokinase
MGDHTDYNFGLSLAAPTLRGTTVQATLNSGPATLISDRSREDHNWEKYPLACLAAARDFGVAAPNIRIEVTSNLPIGKGLSSSTSLTSAILASIFELTGTPLNQPDLCSLSRRVENEYLGIPSGTLDQEVIIRGSNNSLRYIDFASSMVRSYRFPKLSGLIFLVIDTGQARRLSHENIGARKQQCKVAIREAFGSDDVKAWLKLRTLSQSQVEDLPVANLSRKRLRHIWSESSRVSAFVDAIQRGDFTLIPTIINASHESLRDDFDVSTAAVEDARDRILSEPGILAARLIGGGFGGCILAFGFKDSSPSLPYFELHPPSQ